MNLPNRRHPVHLPPHNQYDAPIIVFVTVCTKNRKPILASNETHELLRAAWATADSWLVGHYVIMPDHVHLFCAPSDGDEVILINWVAFWKSLVSQRWLSPKQQPIWQRDFWDRELRRTQSYDEKWRYVVENPVRAGLVAQSSDWPYQGELNELRW